MPGSAYKTCWTCKETKLQSSFNRNCGSKDGRASSCRECSREYCRRWREANPGVAARDSKRYREEHPQRVAALNKRWIEENPQKIQESRQRYAERYPERIKANRAVANAVNRGKLLKPDACGDCGAECETRLLHAHHEDYSRPLDIEWVCPSCHAKR